jgi:hypothetical protein
MAGIIDFPATYCSSLSWPISLLPELGSTSPAARQFWTETHPIGGMLKSKMGAILVVWSSGLAAREEEVGQFVSLAGRGCSNSKVRSVSCDIPIFGFKF